MVKPRARARSIEAHRSAEAGGARPAKKAAPRARQEHAEEASAPARSKRGAKPAKPTPGSTVGAPGRLTAPSAPNPRSAPAPRAAGKRVRAAAAEARRAPFDEAPARVRPSPPQRPLISPPEGALAAPCAPELDWDDAPRARGDDALVARWVARGEELVLRLSAHGAADHEVRADLRGGRFVWVAPSGRVSAEAHAQVLCSWSRVTSVVAMAWADPLVRSAGVRRIEGMLPERDDIDEEGAWRVAMEAAEASGATYLYRVVAPHAWYFLGLRDLTFTPARTSFHPGTPVGLVLRALAEVREAIESRAEPAEVVRDRLRSLGSSLYHQAEYAYRSTDWVARLDRTGKRLVHLAKRLPRPSYSAVAAGQRVEEWLDRDLAIELIDALGLLEDEWAMFA